MAEIESESQRHEVDTGRQVLAYFSTLLDQLLPPTIDRLHAIGRVRSADALSQTPLALLRSEIFPLAEVAVGRMMFATIARSKVHLVTAGTIERQETETGEETIVTEEQKLVVRG